MASGDPGRARTMSQHAWATVVSGSLLLVLAVLLVTWSTPYVVWKAGARTGVLAGPSGTPGVSIKGTPTFPVHGTLLVSATARGAPRFGVPELVVDFISARADVFPDDVSSLPVPTTASGAGAGQLSVWQRNAIIAALRAAHFPTTQAPIVSSIVVGGPAYGVLQVNDVITAVDGVKVASAADVRDAVAKRAPNEAVVFDLVRGDTELTGIQVTAHASNGDQRSTVVGASFANSFTSGAVTVTLNLAPPADRASSGLLVALGIYDMVSDEDLVGGRTIAGIGQVDPTGVVLIDPVAGVRESVSAAAAGGADIYLAPESACPIAATFDGAMRVVKVTNLSDAIDSLSRLAADPASPDVPRCTAS